MIILPAVNSASDLVAETHDLVPRLHFGHLRDLLCPVHDWAHLTKSRVNNVLADMSGDVTVVLASLA